MTIQSHGSVIVTSQWWPDALGIIMACAASVLVVQGGPQALRTPLIGALLVAGPGFALARATRLDDRLIGTVVTVGVSLSTAMAVATAQLYADAWHPSRAMLVLAFSTVVLFVVSMSRRSRRPPHARSSSDRHRAAIRRTVHRARRATRSAS